MANCVQHGFSHPQLPCPWPRCKNGALGDQWRTLDPAKLKMYEGEPLTAVITEQIAWQRKLWRCNHCGEQGYIWHRSDKPLPKLETIHFHDEG